MADAGNVTLQDKSPLGYEYATTTITPTQISLVPILRSGLSMVDGAYASLPLPPLHPLSTPSPPQSRKATN